MIYLSASGIHKSYGVDVILENATLTVQQGERVGLVGPNGAGKSTLLKILVGEVTADRGEIHTAKGISIGYLSQHVQDRNDEQAADAGGDPTVYQLMRSVYNDLFLMENRLRELEQQISDPLIFENPTRYETVSDEYARLSQEFTDRGGYAIDAKVRSILHGLDFPTEMHARPIHTLSGGQKTRLSLGRWLLRQPNLLILDEPTNYLDIATLSWLEDYLRNYPGSLLFVSHDRYFLDAVLNVVYELERGVTRRYKGNYSSYLDQKAAEYEQSLKRYEQQQGEIERMEDFIQRNIVRATTTKRAQSRRKMLERMERVDRPIGSSEQTHFSFRSGRQSGQMVLRVADFRVGYEGKSLFPPIRFELLRGDRVALIGPNGIGKSSLIKAIAGRLDPLSGQVHLGTNVDMGFYAQEQEDLNLDKKVIDELWDRFPRLDQTTIRTTLGHFLFSGDDVMKPVSALSGGEKSRLSLAKLMLEQPNFMILDEPTNHLDLLSKETLETALDEYEGTLLFISHDRYFVNRIATRIFELSEQGLVSFLGDYDDYMEKKAELEHEASSILSTSKQRPSATPLPDPKQDRERKRQEDRARQREGRKQQERLQAVEVLIEQTEQDIAAIEEELCLPDVFSDVELLRQKNERYSTAKSRLESLYEEWEALQASLEADADES